LIKKYYDELTIMKGIGIILVILGHSFSFSGFNIIENNRLNTYIFKTIYSFHMPLFFMIAGFLTNNKHNLTKKFYLVKIRRLLIPYIFINIVDIIPRHLFNELVNNKSNSFERVIFYSGVTTWFIYTLFILFTIFPIIEKYLIKKDQYYLFGIALLVIKSSGITDGIEIFTINKLIDMGFYFYIGYIIKPYYEQIRFSKIMKLIIFGLFIFFSYRLMKYPLINNFVPFLGIISMWLYSQKIIMEKNYKYYFLEFCGINSLSFYLLEVFCGTIYRVILVKIIPIEYNFILFSSFFILKLVTLYIGIKYIICKNKYFSFLLGAKYEGEE
jgi:fucose 4-O-acetylase-like acetyltransferase